MSVIQRLLVDRCGLGTGVVVASVIFPVVHVGALVLTDPSHRLSTLGIYVVLSLIPGSGYECSENLAGTAVIHGPFYAVQFSRMYWASTADMEPVSLRLTRGSRRTTGRPPCTE